MSNFIYLFIYSLSFQVLNHLHKKLKNVSKKSELSKKKVGEGAFLFLFFALTSIGATLMIRNYLIYILH